MLTTDRPEFFGLARKNLFGGALTAEQCDGMTRILDDAEAHDLDPRWAAYQLATAYWETGRTMQPVREVGRGIGRTYGTTYYGRGLVQLTWLANYRVWTERLGIDLVGHPDLALEWPVTLPVLRDGMGLGLFTGVGLARYFNRTTNDPVNARRIINGIDHAATIAIAHRSFLAAINAK